VAKRALKVDDLFDMRWLQCGVLSPDGRRVAYAVTHVDRGEDDASRATGSGAGFGTGGCGDNNAGKGSQGAVGPASKNQSEDSERSTIYLADLSDGTSRQLTPGTYKDTDPAWSPDGSTLAFLSDRGDDDKKQVYLLPLNGGEARKLTSMRQGATAPRWSPDGSKIAFAAGIDHGEEGPPDRSKDPYRVTRNVWRFDAIGDLDLSVKNLYVLDVASGETSQLSNHAGIVGNIRWSPDGRRIYYSLTMLPDRWNGFHAVHIIVRPDGEVEHTIEDRPTLGSAEWLPDGERLLFQGVGSPETPIGTHPDVWVYDPTSGRADNRTEGMELAFGGTLESRMPAHQQQSCSAVISSDGGSAYLQVQRAGRVGISRVSLDGTPDCSPIVEGDRACYLYDGNDDIIVFAAADIHRPPDLYVADAKSERRITSINEKLLADVVMPEVRELSFDGTDGTRVAGWYVSPARRVDTAATDAESTEVETPTENSPPYPTILWIHGGPHGAQGYQFAFDTHLLTGAGYGVMFVNHRASTGYGNAFSTAIHGDWGNLDYGDLMAGVDSAVREGLADPDRLGCCGISGGGNLSCWIVGHTDRFKAAVPQNPVTSWRSFYGVSDIGVWFSRKQLGGDLHEIPEVYDRCSPITYAHRCTTPTLLIQCETDFRCPAEQSEQFYTVLRANGCEVEMLRQPGGSHGGSVRGPLPLRTANLDAKLEWFRRYIPIR
jgi:dipeptidyl aminopeptidase/acylaminoacyl peptidase